MELVRVIALSFADDGKRVKVLFVVTDINLIMFLVFIQTFLLLLVFQVCVQGSMGEGALAGMPLQLAGTRKILEFMDWGDYGAMGTFIKIGSIGMRTYSLPMPRFILYFYMIVLQISMFLPEITSCWQSACRRFSEHAHMSIHLTILIPCGYYCHSVNWYML